MTSPDKGGEKTEEIELIKDALKSYQQFPDSKTQNIHIAKHISILLDALDTERSARLKAESVLESSHNPLCNFWRRRVGDCNCQAVMKKELPLQDGEIEKIAYDGTLHIESEPERATAYHAFIKALSDQKVQLDAYWTKQFEMTGDILAPALKEKFEQFQAQLSSKDEVIGKMREALNLARPHVAFLIARNPQHEEPHKAIIAIDEALSLSQGEWKT